MASITTRKSTGARFISFHTGDGEARYIGLGKVPMRYALACKVRIEDLVTAKLHGHAPAVDTSLWLRDLDNTLHEKLVAVDLVPPRQSTTLGDWLDKYIDGREGDLKPRSHRKLAQTMEKIKAGIDSATPLRSLTPEHASAWLHSMRSAGLSVATIKTHCGNAKTIIGEAVRRKMLDENPFEHLASGPTASAYSRYVTPDEIQRVIDECPTTEWALLFGLARYAGLRIPSESHLLTWADVDWKRGRLTVRSPKTERHAGHEQRLVPIVPKLAKLLLDRFAECDDGAHLVAIRGQGAIMRTVRDTCARAGVEPWERLWQTLRQSCEKEWAMTFPQYAVSKWIGHSITVSGRHYANAVPDELFDAAAAVGPDDPNIDQNGAQRRAQRTRAVLGGNEQKAKTSAAEGSARISFGFHDLPTDTANYDHVRNWRRRESNPRPGALRKQPLRA